MEGWVDSEVGIHQLVKVGETPKIIQLATKPDQKLSAKSDSVLIDGNQGSLDRNDKAYLVFVSHDFDANFELKKPTELSQVALSFLQDLDQGVLPPADIEIWGGMERNKMVSLGKLSAISGERKADEKGLSIINFSPRGIRFLRVKAKNIKVLPPNHPLAKKGKPMLYIDEVAIN